MQDLSLDEVNRHYLDRVISLSDSQPVEAGEDIYSANGIKLLSKGARISREAQERLIMHKLKRPLEVCIKVSDSINPDWLAQAADRVIEETPELRPLFGLTDLTRWIDEIPLNGAMHGMISVSAGQEACGLQHNLRVALVALAIGYKLELPDSDMQILAIAGLLHDMGELYLDPNFIDRKKPISLEAWRHVSAHPVIGYKLAASVCGLHPAAAQAILDHHERGDGSGYPKGVKSSEQSRLGSILSAAELVASIADVSNHSLARADIALRMGMNEFPQDVISVINQAAAERTGPPPETGHTDEDMHALFLRIARVLDVIEDFGPRVSGLNEEKRLFERVVERFHCIQRAFSSSGLDQCHDSACLGALIGDASEWLRFEADLVVHEIRWRMRDLVRDLALRASLLPSPSASEFFQPLVEALQEKNDLALPER
ncbi:HD domain-containing protein [Formivibrio citricus]|uniref:HD domain-containing protein n=1 Tax=Formivibrio citricus TaxID=83765 RepID=A0A1I4XDQ3_9NEIS|nr:HD domain-containing protein [Formivibrio citricus]SFN24048.1 HD domain-containing protein [Formivibrio citricus]